MMNVQQLSKEKTKEEREIPLNKNTFLESENEMEFDNDHTEADSGIHQSIIIFNNCESKNKKGKGLKSFIEKPTSKNFLNGGDFSDFFNERINEEDNNLNSSNNPNNKKFHTVTVNKQNSISSQLRSIINAREKEEDNDKEPQEDIEKDEILEMTNDSNYKFGPFFGKKKESPSRNTGTKMNQNKESKKEVTAQTENEKIIDGENIIKNKAKINYFNNVIKKNKQNHKNNQEHSKEKDNLEASTSKNISNINYNSNGENTNVFLPKIFYNNEKSSFEADFKKLNIDEKLNKEKIYNDPSNIIQNLNKLQENSVNRSNNKSCLKIDQSDFLKEKETFQKNQESIKKTDKAAEIIKNEKSDKHSINPLVSTQNEEQESSPINDNKCKSQKVDNYNSSTNSTLYSNNFPSKNIFTQNNNNIKSEANLQFTPQAYSSCSDDPNSPSASLNQSCNNFEYYLNNQNEFNNLINSGSLNINPLNYYQHINLNNLVGSGNDNAKSNDKQIDNDHVEFPNNRTGNKSKVNYANNQPNNSVNQQSFEKQIDNINKLIGEKNIQQNNNTFQNRKDNYHKNMSSKNNFLNNVSAIEDNNNFPANVQNNFNPNNVINSNPLTLLNSLMNSSNSLNNSGFPLNNNISFNANNFNNFNGLNMNNVMNLNNMISQGFFPNGNVNNYRNPNLHNNSNFNNNFNNNTINNNFNNLTELLMQNNMFGHLNINNSFSNNFNNSNNLNSLLLLSNLLSNTDFSKPNSSNMILFNLLQNSNLMNILPLVNQMQNSSTDNQNFIKEKIKDKNSFNLLNANHNMMNPNTSFNNNNNNNNNLNNNSSNTNIASNSVNQSFVDNINELVIRELENSLNLTDTIDENLFNKIKNNFVNLLRSQNGSRVFQKYLKNTHPIIIKKIFSHIYPIVIDLLMDPYANYFCQKFFVYLEREDRYEFLKKISPQIIEISKSRIGTYPLQVIIEQINHINETELILNTIKNDIMDLSMDTYGCHVIEKVVMCFNEDLIGFIYKLAMENFMLMANNANGLCIIKKVLIHCSKKDTIEIFKKLIIDNCIYLIQNPYGNYTIQIVLDHWSDEHFIPLISQFNYKYTNLSMQKYSSNVVEKCLERSPNYGLVKFIEEVSQMNRVADLMKNNYGNYVVQKALKISSGTPKQKLIISILKNIEKIGDKKLIAKWKSIVINYLPSDNEMNNIDGDLIFKLLKSIQVEEQQNANRSSSHYNQNNSSNKSNNNLNFKGRNSTSSNFSNPFNC